MLRRRSYPNRAPAPEATAPAEIHFAAGGHRKASNARPPTDTRPRILDTVERTTGSSSVVSRPLGQTARQPDGIFFGYPTHPPQDLPQNDPRQRECDQKDQLRVAVDPQLPFGLEPPGV